MAEETTKPELPENDGAGDSTAASSGGETQLERGTYEIIRNRLHVHADELRERLSQLNETRREVFGSIPTELIASERITTENNCVARDMVEIGEHFIFGYNVRVGLRATTNLSDVFAVYKLEDQHFVQQSLDVLSDSNFEHDFSQLYKYYKETSFSKFQQIGPYVFFVFRVGKSATDVKSFKFIVQDDGTLKYVDNRSDHELKFPAQHEFRWRRTHRDHHRQGKHPHVAIEDRLFVETIGGDLTIKVEDNTEDGRGIYSEPVEDLDQTLDDAEILYSIVGNLIILKMRPFREDHFRYLIFNEKTQSVTRLDSIADACVLLPEEHGLIFSKGYYLQSGLSKIFDNDLQDLLFEHRIDSGNGEDFLYVFYTRESGQYVLLAYNMIERAVGTPIICNGYSLFDNGHLLYFKTDDTPQKHHTIQIWRTPFVDADYQTSAKTDSFLFKIGNRDIVRAMAECNEIIALIGKDDSYQNLYVDLLKKSSDVIDTYFWLADAQTHNLAESLKKIQESATAAVDEFDKVVRVRRATTEAFKKAKAEADEAVTQSAARMYRTIDEYVTSLSDLRLVRGQVISLKELKYIDLEAVKLLETKVVEQTDRLSHRCVQFLLGEDALSPYHQKVADQNASIDSIETVAQAKGLEEGIDDTANELEMLIDIVSNLKIDDATHRTQIIDNVSVIYSSLNQTRASLKKKTQSLMSAEGAAEFNSQLKLLGQAVVNYLDVCDSPQKCDEFLTKMMVQIEELEGRFSEFDEFIIQLAEKREEVYAAFDNKKLQLVEARNRRATALMNSADRILKGIASKLQTFESQDEINSYMASDLMVAKVRDIVEKLEELEESVKVDDVQSRLKTVREDATRQLRDKKELFVDGQAIIQFGKHKFSVNTQPLDLTTVLKNGFWNFHLSGTNFFEPIVDKRLEATREVWQQSIESENKKVYRAEYLAYQILLKAESGDEFTIETLAGLKFEELTAFVQKFMAPRYSEGYVKGVHDNDAARILIELLPLHQKLGQLRYSPDNRSLALIAWHQFKGDDSKQAGVLFEKVKAAAAAEAVFKTSINRERYLSQLRVVVERFIIEHEIGDTTLAPTAAEYLFEYIASNRQTVSSEPAGELVEHFQQYLKRSDVKNAIDSTKAKSLPTASRFLIAREWLEAFVETTEHQFEAETISEAAMLIVTESKFEPIHLDANRDIDGMLGDHSILDGKRYHLNYHDFMKRVDEFERFTKPDYRQYVELKKQLGDQRREELRLEEFKPRVLTSFVRNKLINDVYLPLVGANLAKQIGEIGEDKRTDLMGLLLLISPPGYGKTTLMEYLANRLGLTFMKINGPAIGHQVTSLDPTEAPNASAREEVEKLNLALEMGDNVMIYLDDIQHCNPEFLQKFISLCDATRRIEGVFQGRTRTYDLRGRKVCVVMAGNPYTESGEKFQIPDMLANRADTYNLGDVIGDRAEAFELSYLENCLTSNSTLARLNSKSRNDIYSIIEMAKSDEPPGTDLEGNYSIEEINEFVSVMRKLIAIREVVLRVNRLYIDSAAQSEDYRTEPAFKLQGSYRDMNKMAEQVNPIMNEDELQVLINAHFENQAQTLTTGAEANLLKFKELTGQMSDDESQRWDDIKRAFKRNLMLGNISSDDKFGQVIAQMSTFADGLNDIRTAVDIGVKRIAEKPVDEADNQVQIETLQGIGNAVAELAKFNQSLDGIKSLLDQHSKQSSQQSIETAKAIQAALAESQTQQEAKPQQPMRIQVVNRVPHTFLDVLRNQFRVLQTWMDPILAIAEALPEAKELRNAARATRKNYKEIMKKIGESEGEEIQEIIDAEIIDE